MGSGAVFPDVSTPPANSVARNMQGVPACGVGRRGVEAGLEAVLAPPSRGGLRFPLIVKHPGGYGSVGMTKDSKVHNEEQLWKQVARFVGSFGGALVEEFITGREFTVLVVEEPASMQVAIGTVR
eukprot:XP_001703728.1 predicted protein [Chlamydomonas reinhardtii]